MPAHLAWPTLLLRRNATMAGRLVRLDKNPGMMEDPPITQWLFNSTYAAWGWLAVRLYVGY
ncbi:MAG: hypothetical protein EBS89_11625, partial [Proteobacteria bacterium]|nr:hypothetical protein [Pseudomonadota bacterium]